MRTIHYIILISLGMTVLAACSKQRQVKVEYLATGAISEYSLYYIDRDGNLLNIMVEPESALDKWQFSFAGEEGDIVYLSGRYADVNSALNLMIKLDGKIYKQGSSQADTLKFLTVSGVVPYR